MSHYREDYYHELTMPIGCRIEKKPTLQWLKATCPICGKEYEHLSNYKPKTCGKFECLQKANKQGIL